MIDKPLNEGDIKEKLRIKPADEIQRICTFIYHHISEIQRRRGAVIGLSGGIDSSVCAYLAVRALGHEKVLGLSMPEKESDGMSRHLADMIAEDLGIELIEEDITPILDGARCYGRRDEAIRKVDPKYGPMWKSKLVLPSILERDRFNISRLVVESPDGVKTIHRPGFKGYFEIVAASNFKQRARKMMEYHHADRMNYSVIGTPNRLEYQLGFFVKNGDGSADLKPIAHLYKTQVYVLGRHLGIPEEILSRIPTTDTYSLPQTQDEFYFSLPYDRMDMALCAFNNRIGWDVSYQELGLTIEQAKRVYEDIISKMKATRYLHMTPGILDEETFIWDHR